MTYLGLDPSGEIVGVCLCNIYPEENERVGREQGWVDTLGVLREHRGGTAKAPTHRVGARATAGGDGRAAAARLHPYLAGRGYRKPHRGIGLGVDTENPTGALGLYEAVGFRAWKKQVTYRKPLR